MDQGLSQQGRIIYAYTSGFCSISAVCSDDIVPDQITVYWCASITAEGRIITRSPFSQFGASCAEEYWYYSPDLSVSGHAARDDGFLPYGKSTTVVPALFLRMIQACLFPGGGDKAAYRQSHQPGQDNVPGIKTKARELSRILVNVIADDLQRTDKIQEQIELTQKDTGQYRLRIGKNEITAILSLIIFGSLLLLIDHFLGG